MNPGDRRAAIARAQPKLDALTKLATGKDTLLAQTHDFPDPDTIASAWALGWLLEERTKLQATVGYGGVIGRAENKAMIRVLKIKMRNTTRADFSKYDLVALLDTQPGVSNHCIPEGHLPDIVFDHHFRRELDGPEPAFFDVGGNYGATSTKVVELILASGLTPPTEIATALFYGVKSDTLNLGREASAADFHAYMYLVELMDTKLLSEIENPQVPLDYFRVFNKAIMRSKIYGTMIVSDLGEIYAPDLCAEVADRLLQVQGINHSLAVGWYEESLFISLRTRSRARNAGKLLHQIVTKHTDGGAGGHQSMAGARIPVEGKSQRARADLRRKIVKRVLHGFGQDDRHFHRIVKKQDQGVVAEPPPPKKSKKSDSNRPHKAAAPANGKATSTKAAATKTATKTAAKTGDKKKRREPDAPPAV